MRIFAAIDIPEEMALELRELAHDLRKCIPGKFVRPDNYHVTLAFIGEVESRKVDLAASAIEEAVADAGPIMLDPQGLGKFGRANNATLWLGFSESEHLMRLAKRVRDNLESADVPFDQKHFKPHITIARHANASKAELAELPFPRKAYAKNVVLYKSTLNPDGAIYEPLETFRMS